MKRRKNLKLALVDAELSHWRVADAANKLLPKDSRLSEFDITRLVCGRKNPSPEQAAVLASVLSVPISEIFPDVASSLRSVADAIAPASLDCVSGGKEVSNVWKTDGTNQNRCSKCGKFCGEQWGASDSDKMSKRADSLLCESCTLSELDPEKGGES